MAVIYYFSGTGNSLAIAKKLSTGLAAEIKSVAHYLKEPVEITDELIGLVTPVHCMELPPVVARFLQMVRIKGNPFLFCVADMGASAGGTLGQAARILAARGLKLNAGFTVPMPDNSIVFGTTGDVKEEMLGHLDRRIATITYDIQARRDNSTTLGKPALWDLVNSAGWFSLKNLAGVVAKRSVNPAKCVHCGICARVCPMECITLVEGLPQFKEGCSACFACAHWCPELAISLGYLHPGPQSQFTNPEISVQELSEANHK